MQTCERCGAQSPDQATHCVACGADLRQHSTRAAALKAYRENPRVKYIRVVVAADACPACWSLQGTYPKEEVPLLPVEGCSHENGCRCFYEPLFGQP